MPHQPPSPRELEAIRTSLDPEQQCRSDALAAAARLLAPAFSDMTLIGLHANREDITSLWLELAESGAGLIRDGSRP